MTQLLEPDIYQRTSWPSLPAARRRGHGVAMFVALLVVALSLTALDRFEVPVLGVLRNSVLDLMSPLLRVTTTAVTPVLGATRALADWGVLIDDRNRLREENERLKSYQARAQALERQATALTELAHVVDEPKLTFLTARIVATGGGPFVRAALLDAGREHGVKPGYPVMSAQGLVGRVIASGTRSARLLLLTDYNSRIPVLVGANSVRAMMQGDNSPLAKIAYLAQGDEIKSGDEVFTSGVGGLYPRGLRIGSVVDTGEMLRVEPAARLDRLDYVSVLFFDTLAATLADEERAADLRAGFTKRLAPSWPTSAEGGLAR